MNMKQAKKAIKAHYRDWLGLELDITDEEAAAEIDNLKRRGRDVLGLDNLSGLFYRLHRAGVMSYEDLEGKGEGVK